MTRINFEKPTEGARLDLQLLLEIAKHLLTVAIGRRSSLGIQLANSGGLIPVLTAETGEITVVVRYYNPVEGLEIRDQSVSLTEYAVNRIRMRG